MSSAASAPEPFRGAGVRLSPRGRALADAAVVGIAVVFGLLGAVILVHHLATDPLVDVHAYYEAAQRLNAGQPLYAAAGDVNSPHYYFYPPLLAILFRPLALLPFDTAAAIWEVIVLASFGLTLWLLGLRRRRTWIAVAILFGPIAWSLSVGQAQSVVTLLLTIGSPAAVAFAGQLKLFPALVALFWLGRRDWRNLRRFIAWSIALIVFQLVLEPAGSIAFIQGTNLELVGEVNNLSPYAISPVLWLILAVAGFALTLKLAPTRAGWATAVSYSVLVVPRLLGYSLMSLLAGVRDPADRTDAA
jgi:alpha-1,2-mannosyltransferase